jgi:hypothetical protein
MANVFIWQFEGNKSSEWVFEVAEIVCAGGRGGSQTAESSSIISIKELHKIACKNNC